jgi:hypothetical protein
MSSRSKATQPQKKKRRSWQSIAYIIFGVLMALFFILTMVMRA